MRLVKLARKLFSVVNTEKHVLRQSVRNFQQSCTMDTSIKHILSEEANYGKKTKVMGWIKSIRDHKDVVFINVNDGSCLQQIQVILPRELSSRYKACQLSVCTHSWYNPRASTCMPGATLRVDQIQLTNITHDHTFGSCVEVEGVLEKSKGQGQNVELIADKITTLGECNPKEFPFKLKKRHSQDYMRQFLHLRPKSNTFSSLLRVRNAASKAIHDHFQENLFCQIHTPMISSNDCEGAGELFQLEPMWESANGMLKSTEYFFEVPAFLTVSGQLHLEVMTGAFDKVYTFGPTFRAENSRSRHHLSEFYMVEAEMAFIKDIEDICCVVEKLLQNVTKMVLDRQSEDVEFFLKHISPENHKDTIERIMQKDYVRLQYTDAINILLKRNHQFEFPVKWGMDLQKEHERYLVSHFGNVPVFLLNFPTNIKPFYARENDNKDTVASVDLLCVDVGEVCGGTLREERVNILQPRLEKLGLVDNYQWYLDLRRFGSAPHGGFGIGFERYLQTLLGISNIKDTIPFPRSTHNCKM